MWRWLFFLFGIGSLLAAPQTRVDLISEVKTVQPGVPFTVGVRLQMNPGWHTYWKNPGDSGMATRVEWKLPSGFQAGELQWPVPHRIESPPLISFGYEGTAILLAAITPPKTLKPGEKVILEAKVSWLECQEACIPGEGKVRLELKAGPVAEIDPVSAVLLQRPRAQIPSRHETARAIFQGGSLRVEIPGVEKSGTVEFLPIMAGVLLDRPIQTRAIAGGMEVEIPLEKNLIPERAQGVIRAGERVFEVDAPVQIMMKTAKEPPMGWATALGLAFLGGLILNLMPCVLPVLSLKVLGFVREGGESGAWRHGVAFTAGVIFSFWILAGILLILRKTGAELGWGFQLQSPIFVLGMAALMLFLALNLYGFFEVGVGLISLENRLQGVSGMTRSFGSGLLATLIASPCAVPFMGSAVGFAVTQPFIPALGVFTTLALGMAGPSLLLSFMPWALRWVPKPGQWMITLKQALAFPLLATALWLVTVYGHQKGMREIGNLLGAGFAILLAAWLFKTLRTKLGRLMAIGMAIFGIWVGMQSPQKEVWESYDPVRLAALRAEGKPVFVDFTAAWCLTCQVNHRLVLGTPEIQKAFQQRGVILMKADWTHQDPSITRALAEQGRAGVPYYLLYDQKGMPHTFPEVLTSGLVLEALKTYIQP